jgi:hypothetical protein
MASRSVVHRVQMQKFRVADLQCGHYPLSGAQCGRWCAGNAFRNVCVALGGAFLPQQSSQKLSLGGNTVQQTTSVQGRGMRVFLESRTESCGESIMMNNVVKCETTHRTHYASGCEESQPNWTGSTRRSILRFVKWEWRAQMSRIEIAKACIMIEASSPA